MEVNTNKKRNILIFIIPAFILIIIIILFLPTNTIEGISLLDKDYIYDSSSGMYDVIGQRPEKFAQIYIVSHTFSDDERINIIKKYRLAKLCFQIAVKEKKLGRRKSIDPNLKSLLDSLDFKAFEAMISLTTDPSTASLRTDSEGRFLKNLSSGKYFILIRSNKNTYNTSTESLGEINYKDDVVLFAFQSFRYEVVWSPQSKD